jgi:hypothetical protein
MSVEKEQVVNTPVTLLQDKLTNRNPRAGADIGAVSLLNKPTSKNKLPINLNSRPRLTCEIVMVGWSHIVENTGPTQSPSAAERRATTRWPVWRHTRPREALTVARRPGERNRPGR